MVTYNDKAYTKDLRLWLGVSLTALLILLLVRTYISFISSKIPVIMTRPDGVPVVVGVVQPFKNSVFLYNYMLTLIVAIILSSISSVLIYSALTKESIRNPIKALLDDDSHYTTIPLTELEKKALRIIRKRGGVITQAELSRELGLSKYQASRLVKKLEVKGLIERRRAGVTNILILRGSNAANFRDGSNK